MLTRWYNLKLLINLFHSSEKGKKREIRREKLPGSVRVEWQMELMVSMELAELVEH